MSMNFFATYDVLFRFKQFLGKTVVVTYQRFAFLVLSVCCAVGYTSAHAQFFNDTKERDINQIKQQINHIETAGLLPMVNDIEMLRRENQDLKGRMELLAHQFNMVTKRQEAFYQELDNRLRRIESALAIHGSNTNGSVGQFAGQRNVNPSPPKREIAINRRPNVTEQTESGLERVNQYQLGLSLLKQRDFVKAQEAFESFLKENSNHNFAPDAQYWLANSHLAQGDCKIANKEFSTLAARWPQSPRASAGLLKMANCQFEMGNDNQAKATLRMLIDRYPNAPAATEARKKLK